MKIRDEHSPACTTYLKVKTHCITYLLVHRKPGSTEFLKFYFVLFVMVLCLVVVYVTSIPYLITHRHNKVVFYMLQVHVIAKDLLGSLP